MKKITKAIIPVAGFGTRFLPFTKAMPKEMLPVIDTPIIQHIVQEAVESGITDILIVTASHSNKRAIEDHFDKAGLLENILEQKGKVKELNEVVKISELVNLHFIRQKEAKGLGHAIAQGKAFIGDEPFAVLLGDDLVVSETPAIKQLINAYNQKECSIMGVQAVAENQIDKYGIAVSDMKSDLEIMNDFIEKPEVGSIKSNNAVMGRYILSPTIFKYLETQEYGVGGEIQLTDAIKRMMSQEYVYSYVFKGMRYDLGDKMGFLKATVDFALQRDEMKVEFNAYLEEILDKK